MLHLAILVQYWLMTERWMDKHTATVYIPQ